ncbi:tail fiber domain-containing protein [Pseudobdellovibrio sp. HCB154]|uniref:tail fiber domain-containing protein n=1 Tax=Pseudobdellovibrio sp. HCB154 TaxID=3386277 RepID=UPI0039175851
MNCWTLIRTIFFAVVVLSEALAFAGPLRTTYQAKIIKPDGQPLQSSSVNFRFTILDPAATCVIYSEDYTAINMHDSGGVMAFALGAGVRSYPTSGTAATFSAVFDNSTPAFSCQTMGVYLPTANDGRKIVMQFNDGTGWQTLPAMTINAVPYAMYAGKSENSIQLNGKNDTSFVEYSTLASLNCLANEAIHFNGASFSCLAVGGGSVTSGSVITALGYTPADAANVTSVSSTVFSVSSTVSSLAGSVSSLQNSVAASFAALANSGVQSLNGSASGTQTFVTGITGTVFNISSVNGVHTFNIPLAASGSVTAGLLSNADYLSFTNKMNATSSSVISALGYTPVASGSLTSSQWTTSNSTIYYTLGNVGIGTSAPLHTLHVEGDLLVNGGAWGAGNSLNVSGASTRMFFYSKKAAFRGGYVGGTEWDDANIGEGSFAFGANSPQASGFGSIAMHGGYATADHTIAIGHYAQATEYGAVAFNEGQAHGTHSTAFDSSYSTGYYSFAAGSSSASGSHSIALGSNAEADADYAVAIGAGSRAYSYRSTALGAYNVPIAGSNNSWVATDPLLVVGNGISNASRSNAMTILKNGNIGVGLTAPTAKLHLVSGTASTAPLKFTSGTLLASPQSGTMEYDGVNYYVTDGNNIRRTIATGSSQGSIDNASNVNSTGNIVMTPNNGANSVIVSSTVASTSSNTGAIVVNGGLGVAGNINAGGSIQGTSVTATSGMISPYIAGSVVSGGSLTLDSTTHTNKGNILLAPNGGNVGIGTNSPSQKLDVRGGIIRLANADWVASTTGTFLDLSMGASSGNTYSSIQAYNDGGTNAGKLVLNPTAGNVGIGTTNPLAPLHVNTNSTVNGAIPLYVLQPNLVTTGSSIIKFGVNTSATYNVADLRYYYDGSGSALNRFDVGFQGTGSMLSVRGDGNVGIGTTNPLEKLVVGNHGVIAHDGGHKAIGFNTEYDAVNLWNAQAAGAYWGAFVFNPNTGNLNFASNSASGGTETNSKMSITGTGSVGIGTPTPVAKLHIVDSSTDMPRNLVVDNYIAGGGHAAQIWGRTARGTSSAPTATQAGDPLLNIIGGAHDGTAFNEVAHIRILAESNQTPTTQDSFIEFTTKAGTTLNERMRITAAGHVGIGTNTPAYTSAPGRTYLTVKGVSDAGVVELASGFSDAAGNAVGLIQWTDINNTATPTDRRVATIRVETEGTTANNRGGMIRFATHADGNLTGGTVDRMVINSSGNVGIGTLTPNKTLTVMGVSNTGIRLEGTSGNTHIDFTEGGALKSALYWDMANQKTILHSGGNPLAINPSGGNVGIGTLTPTYPLHIERNTNFSTLLKNTGTGDQCTGMIMDNTSDSSYASWIHTCIQSNIPRLKLGVMNKSYGWLSNPFEIDLRAPNGALYLSNAGYVGIGTTTPAYNIDVTGSALIRGGPAHSVAAPSYGGTFFSFDGGTNTAGLWSVNNTTSNFAFYTKTGNTDAGTERMRITDTGRVGIGTPTPGYTLDVNGDLRITGTPYRNGGDVGWTVPSDRRLKDITSDYQRGLKEITNLNMIKFRYKENNPKGINSEEEYTGVIAQEVQQQIPEAVKEDKDGFLSLNTTPIFWAMINAIKDLYKEFLGLKDEQVNQAREIASLNQKLEVENAKLKEENAAQSKELQSVKFYLCAKDPSAPFCK